MLKKIGIALCCLVVMSCSSWRTSSHNSLYSYTDNLTAPLAVTNMTDYANVDLGNAESFRVALLLPLSGQMANIGKSMKNAAVMAIGDINNNRLVIQFYDTKSTSSGAMVAVENALNADSKLILGPLLSEEVMAISNVAKRKDIPLISYSTSPSVLSEGVYTLGLLNEEQLSRIVNYAVHQGRRRLAAVLPDNQSGYNMYKSLLNITKRAGINFVKVGFYNPDGMDFTDLVIAMTSGHSTNENNQKDFGFDCLLIPESGNRLKALSSMFSYYDVSAPEVLFMGTSVWANSSLNKETELYGAVYPVMSLSRLRSFEKKYVDLFNLRPSGLDIIAYDSVALASALSLKTKGSLEQNIERVDGYYGMSGVFRIFANGKNEHGLDIVKITPSGEQVVESAPQKFYNLLADYIQAQTDLDGVAYYDMPQVFGKNPQDLRAYLQ